MTTQDFSNELERALARPDVDQLKRILIVYHDWSARMDAPGSMDDDYPDEINLWFDSREEPDRGLALVMLAAASYDEPEFLGVVAAGLLEDLLVHDSQCDDAFFRRILEEAQKTARFRWMLSGVWTYSAEPTRAAALKEAVGETLMDEGYPLPPRPTE